MVLPQGVSMSEIVSEEQVVAAADQLFYELGVQAVGMDAIRDGAGVTLKRLYRLFPSKADLITAVLEQRDLDVRQAVGDFVEARGGDSRARILSVFDYLSEWFTQPSFRGCIFINTVGELGGKYEAVQRIARQHKIAFRDYFADLVADCALPAGVADQLLILANGAMSTAAILGAPEAGRQARDVAELLLSSNPA